MKEFLKRVLPNFILTPIYLARSYNVVRGKLTYRQDGLFTTHTTHFLSDAKFVEAYELGRRAGIFQASRIHYRAYIACWAAFKGRALEGDYVECGVYRGALSRMVMHYVDFARMPDKRFYLLDTFAGIPERSISEEERQRGRRAGIFEESFEDVKQTFRDFPNVVIVRGTIPDTLSQVHVKKVCYLSLDMNAAAPEIAAAEYFWPKMSSGAVVVLDDYGFTYHEVQRRMFDEFAARQGVKVLPLPTGQGLIFKP